MAGMDINLEPNLQQINLYDYALFNCTYDCTHAQLYTLYWLVGAAPRFLDRSFVKGQEHKFTATSGLSVLVEDIDTCRSRFTKVGVQQLRINGSSVERYNRTAVQCAGVPTSPDSKIIFSSYSIMLVNSPVISDEGIVIVLK